MADTTISIGLTEIIGAGLLGGGSFFMWLLKRSIYGRMDEQDKKIEKQKEEMKDLQTKPICALMQAACQKLLLEKMDSVAMISSREVEAIDGKLDLVLRCRGDD